MMKDLPLTQPFGEFAGCYNYLYANSTIQVVKPSIEGFYLNGCIRNTQFYIS